MECVIPKRGGFQPREEPALSRTAKGSRVGLMHSMGLGAVSVRNEQWAVDNAGALHAGSLGPLVKARAFGMTQLRRPLALECRVPYDRRTSKVSVAESVAIVSRMRHPETRRFSAA